MLRTHTDAIQFLNGAGISASREVSSRGDTVVVALGHPIQGVTRDRNVVMLIPRVEPKWDLVQPIDGLTRKVSFVDLDAACRAALDVARAFAREERCERCGGSSRVDFGEHLSAESLHHWIAWFCTGCGATEYDGDGALPDALRALELVRRGEWVVSIAIPETAAQWAALRVELDLDLKALAKLKRSLPGVVLRGTWGEAERLRRALVDKGLATELGSAG